MPGIKRKSGGDDLCSTLLDGSQFSFADTGTDIRKRKSRMNDTTSDILLDRSVLMSTLKDSGYFVKTGDIPNILTEDQAIFNKKFVKDLSTQEWAIGFSEMD